MADSDNPYLDNPLATETTYVLTDQGLYPSQGPDAHLPSYYAPGTPAAPTTGDSGTVIPYTPPEVPSGPLQYNPAPQAGSQPWGTANPYDAYGGSRQSAQDLYNQTSPSFSYNANSKALMDNPQQNNFNALTHALTIPAPFISPSTGISPQDLGPTATDEQVRQYLESKKANSPANMQLTQYALRGPTYLDKPQLMAPGGEPSHGWVPKGPPTPMEIALVQKANSGQQLNPQELSQLYAAKASNWKPADRPLFEKALIAAGLAVVATGMGAAGGAALAPALGAVAGGATAGAATGGTLSGLQSGWDPAKTAAGAGAGALGGAVGGAFSPGGPGITPGPFAGAGPVAKAAAVGATGALGNVTSQAASGGITNPYAPLVAAGAGAAGSVNPYLGPVVGTAGNVLQNVYGPSPTEPTRRKAQGR